MQGPDKKLKIKDKSLIITASIIKYAKFLAGNERSTRDKALKSLKSWLKQGNQSPTLIVENNLVLLWKGLFYSVWMSDKPLVQEECAENVAKLMHQLDPEHGLVYFKAGLKTLANEWNGIDQLRLDKFLMLVRRLLRQALIVLKNVHFKAKYIRKFAHAISESVLNVSKGAPLGLVLHFTEVYMEEVAKVTEGHVHPNAFTEFLMPFVLYLCKCRDGRQMRAVTRHVFHYLIEQSESGLEFKEKFDAWRNAGFPGGDINCLQKVPKSATGDEDDEAEGKNEDISDEAMSDEEQLVALDARAGRVDVLLPQIKFSPKGIIKVLQEHKFNGSNSKSRKVINQLIHQFQEVAKGDFPLGTKQVELPDKTNGVGIKQCAVRLAKFEDKIFGRAKKNGRKRKMAAEELNGSVKKLRNMGKDTGKMKKSKVATKLDELQVKKSATLDKTSSFVDGEEATAIVACNSGTWFIYENQNNENVEFERKNEDFGGTKVQSKGEKRQKTKEKLGSPKQKNNDVKKKVKNSERNIENDEKIIKNNEKIIKHNKKVVKNNEQTVKSKNIIETKKTKSKQATKMAAQETVEEASSIVVNVWSPSRKPFKPFASEWDRDLQDGETEIFVPSKSYMKKHASSPKTPPLLVQRSQKALKGKNRRHTTSLLAPNLLLNPFANCSTPNGNSSFGGSDKKVKFNLKQNKSQEFIEHISSLKQSPGNPFDASKRPQKPVIKSGDLGASPVNPFFRRNFSI